MKDLEMKSLILPNQILSDQNLEISQALSCDQINKIKFEPQNLQVYEDLCSICFVHFNDLSYTLVLPECNHVFHYDCIITWVKKNPSCPCCRLNLLDFYEKNVRT